MFSLNVKNYLEYLTAARCAGAKGGGRREPRGHRQASPVCGAAARWRPTRRPKARLMRLTESLAEELGTRWHPSQTPFLPTTIDTPAKSCCHARRDRDTARWVKPTEVCRGHAFFCCRMPASGVSGRGCCKSAKDLARVPDFRLKPARLKPVGVAFTLVHTEYRRPS